MTEKRFTMCHEQNDLNGWTMSIIDWETNEPFDYAQYEVHSESITNTKDEMEDLCLLLNELHEENEQLKKELDKLKVVNEMLSMDFANSEHELWKENEQLKNKLKFFNELNKPYGDIIKENEQLKQQKQQYKGQRDYLLFVIERSCSKELFEETKSYLKKVE